MRRLALLPEFTYPETSGKHRASLQPGLRLELQERSGQPSVGTRVCCGNASWGRHAALRCWVVPGVSKPDCFPFLFPSFFFFPPLPFFWFNLKPPQHKEKKKCKNLYTQGQRGLSPWCLFMLSEALPAQSWDLVDLGGWTGCPGLARMLGLAWWSLGVAMHGGPRHFALWIISFSNTRTICSRRHFAPQGCSGDVASHGRSKKMLS